MAVSRILLADAPSERLHFCTDGGWLGAADVPLPADPTDFQTPGLFIACSHLVCGACGAAVRHGDGWSGKGLRSKLRQLERAADWGTLEFLEGGYPGRLYACHCQVWEELGFHACADSDPDPISGDPAVPWRCAGHPYAAVPVTVDGIVVAGPSDARLAAERMLRGFGGGCPEGVPAPCHTNPVLWLQRLHRRLDGTGLEDVVARTAGDALRGSDPVPVGVALGFFSGRVQEPGFEAILERVERTGPAELDRPYPAGGPPGMEGLPTTAREPLRGRLRMAGADLDALDRAALGELQASLLRGDSGSRADDIDAVARVDARWLADHAASVAEVRPEVSGLLLDAVAVAGRPELVTIAALRLVRMGGTARDKVAAWANHWQQRQSAAAFVVRRAVEATAPATAVSGERSVYDELASLAGSSGVARAAAIATELTHENPEGIWDATIALASAGDEIRAAFRDAVKAASPTFWAEHRALLDSALGLPLSSG